MTFINCYISCIDDIIHHKDVNNLGNNFKSIIVRSRYDWCEINKLDLESIKKSNVFIAFISDGYHKSEISMKEFKYAVKTCNKPTICLIKTQDICNYSQLLKYSKSVIKLPADYLCGYNWKENIIMEIKLNIMNLENDQRILCSETKTHENIIFLRGTSMLNDQLAIIGYNRYSDNYYIYVYNVKNFKLIKSISTSKFSITKPGLIISNKLSELLIADTTIGVLYVLNSDFKSQAKIIDYNLKNYADMCIDEETNDIYFVSFMDRSEIKIVNHATNSTNQIYRDDWDDFKPFRIKVFDDKIIILNASSLRINQKTRDLIETNLGDSFIFIFEKSTKKLKLKIDLKLFGYYQPWSLFVNKKSNIIYTSVLKSLDGTISNERVLLKFQNDDLTPIQIENVNEEFPNDSFLFNNNRLVILKEESINFYFLI